MTRLNSLLLAGGLVAMLCLGASDAMGQGNQGGGRQGGGRQGRGNFDPAQFQQRMMDRYKEQLEITDDAEWKAIQPLVQKVMDARRALDTRGRGMGGRGQRPGGNTQADTAQRPAGAPANPEAEALQKAVDSKASSADLKTAMAKYFDSRKVKQAELEKVQADLRKVLTPRQEAIAALSGLL
jgi:hypothetical protein